MAYGFQIHRATSPAPSAEARKRGSMDTIELYKCYICETINTQNGECANCGVKLMPRIYVATSPRVYVAIEEKETSDIVCCCVECGSWFPEKRKTCGLGHQTRQMEYRDFQKTVEQSAQPKNWVCRNCGDRNVPALEICGGCGLPYS